MRYELAALDLGTNHARGPSESMDRWECYFRLGRVHGRDLLHSPCPHVSGLGVQSNSTFHPHAHRFHSHGLVGRSRNRTGIIARRPSKSRAGIRHRWESPQQAGISDGKTDVDCSSPALSPAHPRESIVDLHRDVHSPTMVAKRHDGDRQGVTKIVQLVPLDKQHLADRHK